MKKLKALGLAAMAAGMFSLTSCLDGGGNTQSGSALGYATFNMDAGGIVVTDDFGSVVASGTFNTQLSGGEYVAYAYSVDWDSQTSNKYTVATVSGINKFTEVYTQSSITDTTALLSNELPVQKLAVQMYSVDYAFTANNHIFMSVYHEDVPSDMKTQYELSYDSSADPAIVGGKRVYDFYLRAMKIADGEKVKENVPFTNVYDLSQFLSRMRSVEKAAGNTSVNIRINYINKLGDDYSSSKKEQSDVISFIIPNE